MQYTKKMIRAIKTKILYNLGLYLSKISSEMSNSMDCINKENEIVYYTHDEKIEIRMSNGVCVQFFNDDEKYQPKILRDLNEISMIEYTKKIVRPRDWVIDTKAGVGVFTHCVASYVGEEGKVIALENDKKYYDLLQSTVRLNKTSSVVETHHKSKKTIDTLVASKHIRCCKLDASQGIRIAFKSIEGLIKERKIDYVFLDVRTMPFERTAIINTISRVTQEMQYKLLLLNQKWNKQQKFIEIEDVINEIRSDCLELDNTYLIFISEEAEKNEYS